MPYRTNPLRWWITVGVLWVVAVGAAVAATDSYLQGKQNHHDVNRLAVQLCQDTASRIQATMTSDLSERHAASKQAGSAAVTADQWYIALRQSPKDAPNRLLAWKIWAAQRRIYYAERGVVRALRMRDNVLAKTGTSCRVSH